MRNPPTSLPCSPRRWKRVFRAGGFHNTQSSSLTGRRAICCCWLETVRQQKGFRRKPRSSADGGQYSRPICGPIPLCSDAAVVVQRRTSISRVPAASDARRVRRQVVDSGCPSRAVSVRSAAGSAMQTGLLVGSSPARLVSKSTYFESRPPGCRNGPFRPWVVAETWQKTDLPACISLPGCVALRVIFQSCPRLQRSSASLPGGFERRCGHRIARQVAAQSTCSPISRDIDCPAQRKSWDRYKAMMSSVADAGVQHWLNLVRRQHAARHAGPRYPSKEQLAVDGERSSRCQPHDPNS